MSEDKPEDRDQDDEEVEVPPGVVARDDPDPGSDDRQQKDQPFGDTKERNKGDDRTDQRDEANNERGDVEHKRRRSINNAPQAAAFAVHSSLMRLVSVKPA